MSICTEQDEFVRLLVMSRAVWVATLGDGRTVYQDDGRPGENNARSAWLRLGDHLRETGGRVVDLELRFRGVSRKPLPSGAPAYFWRRELGAFISEGMTRGFYLIGYLSNDGVVVQRWSVPDLTPIDEETRDPNDHEAVGASLITNPAA